jgi:hypothetical protein
MLTRRPPCAREDAGCEVGAHPAVALGVLRAAAFRAAAVPILAREDALSQRTEDELPDPVPFAPRELAPLEVARQERVLVLVRDRAIAVRSIGDLARDLELVALPVRHPPVEQLPLAHEILVGANGLLDRHRRVRAMALVEVEVVRAESRE